MPGNIDCNDCRQLTSGDCGKHQIVNIPSFTILPEQRTAPFKCPCCDGWGQRCGPTGCAEDRVQCPSCKGTGLVWEPTP
jgi:hypothetical protein